MHARVYVDIDIVVATVGVLVDDPVMELVRRAGVAFSLVAVGLVANIGLIGVVSAHERGENNNVAVVMHVEPNDTPVAGAPSQLHFYFSGTGEAAGFDLVQCDCQVSVRTAGRLVVTEAIKAEIGSSTHGSDSVTFRDPGEYDIEISGSSRVGSFEPFTIPFRVQVGPSAAAVLARTALIERVGFGVAILVAVGLGIWFNARMWRKPTRLPRS